MKQFEILVSSPPDRENLVVEIWHGEILVAEINQETEELEIEFYLNERIAFRLNEFLEILEIVKRKLKNE